MGINVTDYRYLFEALNNKSSGVDSFGRFELNNIGSKGIQSQLRAAGIDTNSKAYQKVVGDMMKAGGGRGFTNIQGIKNLMKNYDENGDYISPVTGLTGMDATNIPISQRHKIIDIPEKSRQEMFDNAKREFLQENGVANGDTTKRSDVFYHYQKDAKKENRLKGTWTLEQYERQYNKAFEDAVKAADPTWRPGKKIPEGALDGITREAIDKSLVKTKGQYGETFTRGMDMRL